MSEQVTAPERVDDELTFRPIFVRATSSLREIHQWAHSTRNALFLNQG